MNIQAGNSISVEKAMKRGEFLLIAVPMYLVLLVIAGIAGVWDIDSLDPVMKLIYSILLLAVPVVYRSVAVTYWYIWAFMRVRNVQELKRKSLKEYILFKKGTWMERIEFRTLYQKEILQEIGDKLKQKDDKDYKDLYPASIEIRFSRYKLGAGLFFTIFFIVIGIWLLYDGNLWGSVSLVIGLFCGWAELRKFKQKGDQLRFDDKGIFSAKYGFVPWNKIRHEYVETIEGEHETSTLKYMRSDEVINDELMDEPDLESVQQMIEEWKTSDPESPIDIPEDEDLEDFVDPDELEEKGYHEETVDIDDFDMDAEEIRKMLRVYRNRYRQSLSKDL